jgi:hypothetical protein
VVVAQERQAVEGVRALGQLFPGAVAPINPVGVNVVFLPVGDFAAVVGVDGFLADVGQSDVQETVFVEAALCGGVNGEDDAGLVARARGGVDGRAVMGYILVDKGRTLLVRVT